MTEHPPTADHLPDDAVVAALALDMAIDLAGHVRTPPGREGYPIDDAHDDLLEMAGAIRAIAAADRALAGPAAHSPAATSPLGSPPTAPVVSLRPVVLPPTAMPPRRARRWDRRRQVVAVAVAASAITLAIGADLALQAGGGAGPTGTGWAVPAAVRMTLAGDRVALVPPGGGPSSADRVTAVDCATAQHCVAVADADGHAVIAVSDDGGTTWQRRPAPVAAAELSAILCATPEHCWAVGSGNTGGRGNEAAIVATNDGGRTWSTESAPAGVGSLESISCPTVETCWAGGSADDAGTAIVATNDGGRTWSTESAPAGVGSLESISCPTVETCWAGGQIGGTAAVVATADGGRSWEQEALPAGDTAAGDTAAGDTAAGDTAVTGSAVVTSARRLTAGAADATTISSITCTPALTCWATATDGDGTMTVLADGPEGWHVSAEAPTGGAGISGFVASPGCATGCPAAGGGAAANAALTTLERGTATTLRGRTTAGAVTCPTARECWLVRTSGTGFTSTALHLGR